MSVLSKRSFISFSFCVVVVLFSVCVQPPSALEEPVLQGGVVVLGEGGSCGENAFELCEGGFLSPLLWRLLVARSKVDAAPCSIPFLVVF